MDILIAFAVSLVLGLIAGWIVHVRFKDTVFGKIQGNVAFATFLLLFSFALFGIIGFNIWTITIIPVVCLFIVLFIVRNAIGKLLEVK